MKTFCAFVAGGVVGAIIGSVLVMAGLAFGAFDYYVITEKEAVHETGRIEKE